MADKKITRQLSIHINGKDVKNSLGGIGREISKVRGQLKEANDPADIKKYKAELDLLGQKYGEVKDEIHGTNVSLEDARGHWDNLISGFLSGNLSQVKAGLLGIAASVKAITKASLAFIATPIGAAIAVIASVGVGVKQWVSYNLAIEKTNQLIRDLTNETGIAVDVIRARAEVLKDTFEVDINQSVTTAKSLVKSFGISYNEAFDIIEDGAVRGKLKNDEFLEALKEYPIQFKNAGFSAADFANIVSAGIDLSIYSDKLPDAIKEFNLAITEQTKAASDALTNAFGPAFTGKLLAGVKSGSVSAKQALALISEEANRIGLNAQQAQQLTADLFKGAGEDAGGALKIFEAVNTALNNQKKPLTEIQQLQQQQLNANKELNSVYTQLFASGSAGLNSWIQKGKLFATQTLLKILKGGVDVYNWFIELNNESSVFSGILKSVGLSATSVFEVIGILINGAKQSFSGLADIVAGVFTGDLSRIRKGFANNLGSLASVAVNLKNKVVNNFKEIVNAYSGLNKLEKFSLEDFTANTTGATDTTNTNDTTTANTAVVDSDGLTAKDKQILESKKRLKELLAENELEEEAQRLEEEALNAETLEEQTQLNFERLKWIAEQELEIQKNKELESLRSKNATEEEIAAVEEKYRLKRHKLTTKLENEKAKAEEKIKAQKEASDEKAKKREMLVLQQRASAYADMFGNIAQLLGENTAAGKAAAIAQATINTFQGVTQVWASPSVLPEPFGTAAKVVSTATVLASGLGAVKNIKGTKGFYYGGNTGTNGMYNDEYGPVTGVVHDNEWVAPKFMTQSPRYAPTLQWLEQERKRNLGQYFNGGDTSTTQQLNATTTNETTTFQDAAPTNTNTALLQAINTLNSTLNSGIKSYTVRDYEDFLLRKEIEEEHNQILENTRQ